MNQTGAVGSTSLQPWETQKPDTSYLNREDYAEATVPGRHSMHVLTRMFVLGSSHGFWAIMLPWRSMQ